MSDFRPSDSGSQRHRVDKCNLHDQDGYTSEASDSKCPSNPRGERRRCSRQARADRREQRRWSTGVHSTGPRTVPAHLMVCSTSSHIAMLHSDKGAKKYYHHCSTSQEMAAMATSATRGIPEAVSPAGGQQAVEPCRSAGSPLARASALCEVYLKLLSRR